MSKFTDAVKKAFTRTNTPEQLAGIPDEAYEALEKAIGDEIGPDEVEAFLATDEAIAARQAQDVGLLRKAAQQFAKQDDPDADDEPDDDEDDDGEDDDDDGEDPGDEGDESEDDQDEEDEGMKKKVAAKAKELFGGGKQGMKKALEVLEAYDEDDAGGYYEDPDDAGDVVFESPEDLVKAIVDPIVAAIAELHTKQARRMNKLEKAIEQGNSLRKAMAPDLAALARLPVPSGRNPGGTTVPRQRPDSAAAGMPTVDGQQLEGILQKALASGLSQPAETSTLRAAVKMGAVSKQVSDRIEELRRACGDA